MAVAKKNRRGDHHNNSHGTLRVFQLLRTLSLHRQQQFIQLIQPGCEAFSEAHCNGLLEVSQLIKSERYIHHHPVAGCMKSCFPYIPWECSIHRSLFITKTIFGSKGFFFHDGNIVYPAPMSFPFRAYHRIDPVTPFPEIHSFGLCSPGFRSPPTVEQFGCSPGLPDPLKRSTKLTFYMNGAVCLVYGKIKYLQLLQLRIFLEVVQDGLPA